MIATMEPTTLTPSTRRGDFSAFARLRLDDRTRSLEMQQTAPFDRCGFNPFAAAAPPRAGSSAPDRVPRDRDRSKGSLS